MATLSERTTVHCPYDQVRGRLRKALGGDTATIALRVPVGDLHIEKDVQLNLRPKKGYPGYEVLDVTWTPKAGPYPSFRGTITVEDEGGGGWSRIDLEGEYKPPFYILGAAFDAAFGKKIAEAAAIQLLSQIKTWVGTTRAEISAKFS
jgi:hypothetical protein